MNVGPGRNLPVDGTIQIAFDRYLLPASITRQSVAVLDASGAAVDPVLTTYDPVSRTVSVSGSTSTWLTPGLSYKLKFTIPPDEDVDDRGLRAIDRATLDLNQPLIAPQPVGPAGLEIAFFAEEAKGQKAVKDVSFCGDVMPIFSMKCVSGVCHAGSTEVDQAAGLVLDSFTGIQKTAIGRIANGASSGGRSIAAGPRAPRRVFGVDMPIIQPGEPDNSWLLYKIELAREPVIDTGLNDAFICNSKAGADTVALPTSDPFRFDVKIDAPSDFERSVLSDYVLGREMPFPQAGGPTSSRDQGLTFDERQRIRLWIAQGAKLEECGGCTSVAFVPDAGAPDVGPPADAGADDAATDADASADAADQ